MYSIPCNVYIPPGLNHCPRHKIELAEACEEYHLLDQIKNNESHPEYFERVEEELTLRRIFPQRFGLRSDPGHKDRIEILQKILNDRAELLREEALRVKERRRMRRYTARYGLPEMDDVFRVQKNMNLALRENYNLPQNATDWEGKYRKKRQRQRRIPRSSPYYICARTLYLFEKYFGNEATDLKSAQYFNLIKPTQLYGQIPIQIPVVPPVPLVAEENWDSN